MTASHAGKGPQPTRADADDAAADTAPEIAADDAGASAMAERKGKEQDQQKQVKP